MSTELPAPTRHCLLKSLTLHLAPGVLLFLAFLLVIPVVNRVGGSSYLALLICIPLVLVPFEAGVLLVERSRCARSWGFIVGAGRGSGLSAAEALLTSVPLYLISSALGLLVAPSRQAILRAVEHWYPPGAIVDGLPAGVSPYTLWLGLLLSGCVAPIVEELYFRGFLMPRIPLPGLWPPAVSAALFSVYHFFSPWNGVVIFALFLPLAYYVRLRGKLLPVIITHSLFNSVGLVVMLVRS